MKWTKASEKMPVVENRASINIKYKGRAALIVFYHGEWYWSDNSYSETHLHPVEKDSWSAIEYLDETEQASPDGLTKEQIQKQIEIMAHACADKRWKPESFRWQKVVEVYIQAINEWIGFLIYKGVHDTKEGPPSMPLPAREPFPEQFASPDGWADLGKLKSALTKSLIANEDVVDEPYIYSHGKVYSRRELSYELQMETAVGIELIKNVLLLSIDLLARKKESLPASPDAKPLIEALERIAHYSSREDWADDCETMKAIAANALLKNYNQ